MTNEVIKKVVIGLMLLLLLLFVYINRQDILDTKELGLFNYPSRSGKAVVIHASQRWGDRVAALDDKIDEGSTPGSYQKLINKVETAGQHAYMAELAKEKGLAEAEGLRVHAPDLPSVNAQYSQWQPTFKKVFAGDLICAGGQAWNELYEPEGTVLVTGPEGFAVKSIDGHTARYPNYPMLAFLGSISARADRPDENRIVHLVGCKEMPYSGYLHLVANNPYWNPNGLVSTGFANHTGGTFAITRREPAANTNKTKEDDIPSQAATTPDKLRISPPH